MKFDVWVLMEIWMSLVYVDGSFKCVTSIAVTATKSIAVKTHDEKPSTVQNGLVTWVHWAALSGTSLPQMMC